MLHIPFKHAEPLGWSFDKRTIDNNGHLHVPNCRVTKASVDKYLGTETGGASLRGFSDMDTIAIYRDEQELVKALASFDTVPLMAQHVVTTADDPQKDLLVGAATNPRWEAPYVIMDLTIWDQAGIDLIESKEQAELSAGYSRELDWTPGKSPDGLQYDARMFNIKCNHVALVRKGRVDGAVVADQAPEVSMFDKLKFPKIVAALMAAFSTEKKAEVALALDAALESEFAEDAKKKKGSAASEEEAGKVIADPEAEMSEDEKAAAVATAKKKKDDEEAAAACAMDEKINAAVTEAVAAAEARVHGLYVAKGAVAEKVGEVSLDSAEKVYRFALTKVGVEHEAVAADALPALWESSQSKSSGGSMDSAPVEPLDICALFPGLGLIRKG